MGCCFTSVTSPPKEAIEVKMLRASPRGRPRTCVDATGRERTNIGRLINYTIDGQSPPPPPPPLIKRTVGTIFRFCQPAYLQRAQCTNMMETRRWLSQTFDDGSKSSLVTCLVLPCTLVGSFAACAVTKV